MCGYRGKKAFRLVEYIDVCKKTLDYRFDGHILYHLESVFPCECLYVGMSMIMSIVHNTPG